MKYSARKNKAEIFDTVLSEIGAGQGFCTVSQAFTCKASAFEALTWNPQRYYSLRMQPALRSLSRCPWLAWLAPIALIVVTLDVCAIPPPGQNPWQSHEPVHLLPNEAGLLVWITDPTGGPIRNAKVFVVDVTNGESFHGVTNAQGVFKVRGLPPGTFEIKVSVRSFGDNGATVHLTL